MKPMKSVSVFLMIFFCMTIGVFSVNSAVAYNLSLQATSDGSTDKTQFIPGEDLYLNIVVDNAEGIAGCAFTLNYPANILTAPATDAEGTPVTTDEITSIFPFSYANPETSETTATHRENSSESGKIYFAGAEIDTTDGGAKYGSIEIVLFTVRFKVKNDAPKESFEFSLAQTELWNLDAGYGIDNNSNDLYDEGVDQKEKVSVLVGAVAQGEPGYDNFDCTTTPCAFPILLEDLTQSIFLQLAIVPCPDVDQDGLCDSVETNTGTYIDSTDTGTDPDNNDTDSDGLKDGDEVNTHGTNPVKADSDDDGYSDAVEVANSTDPNIADPPGGNGYDSNSDIRTYKISGIITYNGSQTGKLYVKVYNDVEMTNEVDSILINDPVYSQIYSIDTLAPKETYYLKAFIDLSSGVLGEADPEEASGALAVDIASDMSESDIVLENPLSKIYFDGHSSIIINKQSNFELITEVPDGKTLKAYNIRIGYDDSLLQFISTNSLPTFPPANVNTDQLGVVLINGFNTTGIIGPSSFGLIEITFEAKSNTGNTQLTITLNSYGEDETNQFPPTTQDFDLNIADVIRGDADGSGSVDIFDALIVAEYDAQLKTVDKLLGFVGSDVDDSGFVDIFDALKIAEYDAGLIANLD